MSTPSIVFVICFLIAIAVAFMVLKMISTKKQLPELLPQMGAPSSKPKLPIEKVRDFLSQDLENKGFNDALVVNDSEYCKQKTRELKELGKQICNAAISEYRHKIIDIEAQIRISTRDGYSDLIDRLNAQKDKYQNNIDNITEMKADLENEDSSIFISYKKGFDKQRRAIAEGLVEN